MNPSSTPAFFGGAELVTQPSLPAVGYEPPIQQSIQYINNLPVPITVELRSGFKFILPPLPDMSNNRLLIRVTLTIHPSMKVHVQRLLSAVNESSSAELKLMRDSFLVQMKNTSWRAINLTLDYPMSLDDLKRLGGTVYYHELDTLVSMMSFDNCPPHPHSPEGRRQRIVEVSDATAGKAGFAYSINLIDNSKKHGDRYINIGGSVYRISPVQDPTQRDGIYVVSNAATTGAYALQEQIVKHYPFEGADETVGLYLTAEDASVLGDVSMARRRELADLEHQMNLQKVDLQRAKQDHEEMMLKKNQELVEMERTNKVALAELERERAREESEKHRLKDYYESRSLDRKDSSEALKFIPTILVGIGALIMTIKAFLPAPAKLLLSASGWK